MPDWLKYVDSEPTIARLAELGVNMMIGHYWKGFGIEAESAERENIRRKIETCHRQVSTNSSCRRGTLGLIPLINKLTLTTGS